MNLFLVVRSFADIQQACRDVNRLFSYQKVKNEHWIPGSLVGVWYHEKMVENLPGAIPVSTPDGQPASLQIKESVGVSGVWRLCRLQTTAISFEMLHEAMIALANRNGMTGGSYSPVIRVNEEGKILEAEMEVVGDEEADVRKPPLFQNPHTGAVYPVMQPYTTDYYLN